MSIKTDTFIIIQNLFNKGLAIVYLSAFASWYYQISALFGKDGITPTNIWIQNMYTGYSPLQKFFQIPSLILFSEEIIGYLQQYIPEIMQYDMYETTFYLICILGSFISLLTLIDIRNQYLVGYISQFILYFLYLSIYYMGQNFSSFQWDVLLLEVGFVAIFFVPKKQTNSLCVVSKEILKFIGFKLFYSSGILKFASNCPTWWGLTALNYHFWSQPLPHYLSWYFNLIPDEIKKLMVVGNFICLIGGGILFYSPFRIFRIFGGLLNILMQVNIILSGNYNFFNFLSILLFHQFLLFSSNSFGISSILDKNSKLNFTIQDLDFYCINGMLPIIIATLFMIYLVNAVFYDQMNNKKEMFIFSYMRKYVSIILAVLFFILNVNSLFQGINIKNNPLNYIFQMEGFEFINRRLQLSHSYGLFRRMTGIQGREELIFEGSYDGKNWQEFEFKFKPGNDLSVAPQFISPHQPRIDWQLWFSAMRREVQEPYLIGMIQKLFKNSPSLMTQLKNNPFLNKPATFIRIVKYNYEFTNYEESQITGNWWKRNGKKMFLNQIKNDSQLQQQYKQMKIDNLTNVTIPLHPFYEIPLLEIIYTTLFLIAIRFWILGRNKQQLQ